MVFWVSFPQNRLLSVFSAGAACLTGAVLALVRYVLIAEPRVRSYGWPLYAAALLFHVLPPVALSSAVFGLLGRLRVISPEPSGAWASWLLIALVPYEAVFALSAPEPGTVKALVLLPVLWVTMIVVLRFFHIRITKIRAAGAARILARVLFGVSAIAVSSLGAAAYFAWFTKETVLPAAFLLPLAVFALLHFLLDYKAGK